MSDNIDLILADPEFDQGQNGEGTIYRWSEAQWGEQSELMLAGVRGPKLLHF